MKIYVAIDELYPVLTTRDVESYKGETYIEISPEEEQWIRETWDEFKKAQCFLDNKVEKSIRGIHDGS
jgi:hypothetical protein